MKNVNKAMLVLMGLAAVACSKSRFSHNAPKPLQEQSSEVKMQVEDIEFADITRTQVSSDELSGLSFKWSEKDTVGVYSSDGGFSRYSLKGGGGMQSATFDGQGFALTPGDTYYALYPYDGGKSDPSKVGISYEGREVSGPGNVSDILAYDPLYASAEATVNGGASFAFSHFSSFARLGCNFPEAVSPVSMDLLPTYEGIVPGGSLNIMTGTWKPEAGKTVTTIPLTGIGASKKGDRSMLWVPFAPQDFSSNDIAAVMKDAKGNLYTSRMDGKNLKSGKAYRWELDMVKFTNAAPKTVTLTSRAVHNLELDITGQFSGITKVGENRYAVVHDNRNGGGIVFLNFKIESNYGISGLSCEIPEGTASAQNHREPEGIAYFPGDGQGTLFVAAEGDQRILEYDMNGYPTGRELAVPDDMKQGQTTGNFGFESLAYNAVTGKFWTTTEHNISRDKEYVPSGRMLLRLQSFGNDLQPSERFFYLMDTPQEDQTTASVYAFGVPDILALDDGKLLVLEREAHIPNGNVLEIGLYSIVYIKVYEVDPVNDKGGILSKRLVLSDTFYSALNYSNYEGIGFGPVVGGKQTVLMISDSQDHYKGVLKDKLRILTIGGTN